MPRILGTMLVALSLTGLAVASASAFDEAAIKSLAPDQAMRVSGGICGTLELRVKSVATIIDSDSTWYAVTTVTKNGKEKTLFIDFPKGVGEVDISIKKVPLRDLSVRRQDLERMDDRGKGNVNFNGQKYDYVDSDDAHYKEKGADTDISYYEFASEADEDDGLMIFQMDDNEFDVFVTKPIDASAVTVVK